jgi:putative ABC transport system substrate-binding protein
MNAVALIVTVALGLLLAPLAVEAQQPAKIARIGYLRRPPPIPAEFEALRQGLRELGYVEGQNIVIEQRYAGGVPNRLPPLAAELVRLKVDVIVADGTLTVRALKAATPTIPVVFTVVSDPVGSGLIASLARPGGNVTGVTTLGQELSGKRLELLKEGVPGISRVAVLTNPDNPVGHLLKEMHTAARSLALQLQIVETRTPSQLGSAFRTMEKGRANGLVNLPDALFSSQRERIAELATKTRLPGMFTERGFVEAGGLMAYAPSIPGNFRRAAAFVEKILRGANPADLPVEQPTKFELVINLKTAKALGLTIPQSILSRADQVIQ